MKKLLIALSAVAALSALSACTDDSDAPAPVQTVTTYVPVPSASAYVVPSASAIIVPSASPSVSVSTKVTDLNKNDVPGDGGR